MDNNALIEKDSSAIASPTTYLPDLETSVGMADVTAVMTNCAKFTSHRNHLSSTEMKIIVTKINS